MKKVLILVVSMVTVISGACLPIESAYNCSSPEHQPVDNPYFQLLWSRSGIVIYPDPSGTLMQGLESKVFVVTGQDAEFGGSKILAFNTRFGNVLWQRSIVLPASIITNGTQLYTGLYDKIEVVDPHTGNLVNVVEVPKVGFIYNIFATEHNLYGFTKSGRWLTYNIDDGTYSLSEPFLPYTPFLIENGIMYLYEGREIKAKELESQSILWEYPIDEEFDPIFTDNIIIILGWAGNIYGLDKETGNLIWSIDEHAISNVTMNRSHLFVLTNDGYLKVLDINNGQELTKLKFMPGLFETNSPPSGNIIGAYDLWVDLQNDILIASFGDSCQLMALKSNFP